MESRLSRRRIKILIKKSCTIVDQLTDLDKSIIKILESKYHAEKILTDVKIFIILGFIRVYGLNDD
jgi:hypothetical protein